jgi:hypothetical protein
MIEGKLRVFDRTLGFTDRDRASYSRYGSIASYAPFDAVLDIALTSGGGADIFQVNLNNGRAWQLPIDRENQRVAEGFTRGSGDSETPQ